MTLEEYTTCRLLGMRICVWCNGPIDMQTRDYHCSKCLTDSDPGDINSPRRNHACGIDDCWEMDLRKLDVHAIILRQRYDRETPSVRK